MATIQDTAPHDTDSLPYPGRICIFNSLSPSGDLNEIEGLPRESGRLRWLAELWPHYSIFVQGRSGNESRAFLVKG